MSDVQFDENLNAFTSRRILGEEVVPGMTKLLLKTGVIKNSKQAEYILIGTIVACLLLTGFVLYRNFAGTNTEHLLPKNPTSEDIRRLMENPKSFLK